MEANMKVQHCYRGATAALPRALPRRYRGAAAGATAGATAALPRRYRGATAALVVAWWAAGSEPDWVGGRMCGWLGARQSPTGLSGVSVWHTLNLY